MRPNMIHDLHNVRVNTLMQVFRFATMPLSAIVVANVLFF